MKSIRLLPVLVIYIGLVLLPLPDQRAGTTSRAGIPRSCAENARSRNAQSARQL